MSSAALCLFGVTLCNVGSLDQNLFGDQQAQNQQPSFGFNGQNFFNAFTGLNQQFNSPVQQQSQQQQQQLNGRNGNRRPPHQTPCPGRFRYVTDGKEWIGVMKFPSFDLSKENIIEADFVLPQRNNRNGNRRFQLTQQGRIELVNDPNTIANNLENGIPILFEAFFTLQNPVPKLLAIYKNGNRKCFDQNIDPNTPLNTFRLTYTLPAQGYNNGYNNPQNQQRPSNNPPLQNNQLSLNQRPQNQRPQNSNNNNQRPSQNPQINQNNADVDQDDKIVCGVPIVNSQTSVYGGEPVKYHGEWPWLVAFYKSAEGHLMFICGGSLLNARYVLTAAHCIQDKGRTTAQREQDALLFIGKHNLIKWNEEGYEKRGALKFKVHPDWNPQTRSYDGDVALIQMVKPVKYSKFIRPICLWNGLPDITKVVGQVGVIAGWGKNDNGQLNTDFPKKINVPIVSDGTCLRANDAFVHITSDRTFCAGGRNGEGPCQGDSGGGLMLKVNNKWFIRGIVSASLRDGISCDKNSYAIFADIAKMKPWIMENIKADA